jgi:hypothetical protein
MLKKKVYAGILLIVIVAVAALLVLQSGLLASPHKDKTGFTMVSLSDNSVLLSDSDVLSFNSTSQEFLLTDTATQRMQATGTNLYNFSKVYSIKVNGEEIYHGIFRNAAMSAVPEPPTIAILYPSITFPEGTEKPNMIRLFYPSFTPPSSMQAMNQTLTGFFEDTYRLAKTNPFLDV